MDTRESQENIIGKNPPTPQDTARRLVGFLDRATIRLRNALSRRDRIDEQGRDLEDRDPTFGSGKDDGQMWISGDPPKGPHPGR
jgi:hypothetical protein